MLLITSQLFCIHCVLPKNGQVCQAMSYRILNPENNEKFWCNGWITSIQFKCYNNGLLEQTVWVGYPKGNMSVAFKQRVLRNLARDHWCCTLFRIAVISANTQYSGQHYSFIFGISAVRPWPMTHYSKIYHDFPQLVDAMTGTVW
jgi:hypothetical protein